MVRRGTGTPQPHFGRARPRVDRVSTEATHVSSRSLPRSTPSAQGVDARGLTAFVDALESTAGVEPHSLQVLRHGHVVAEGWWTPFHPDRPHLLYSLSKSFTSTALGFAVAEGLVDLDATVLSYFPEFDADVTDERSRRILVRHVANMASGHREETIEQASADPTGDIVRGFLRIPPDAEPGTLFCYNQPCTFSVSAIVQRTSGQGLLEYLRPRLLDPLGVDVENLGWLSDGQGRELGFSGFHAPTELIAKLGQLYLQRGVWEGRRLLPESWVEEATTSHVDNASFNANPDWQQGYGYQFWIARHGYRGDGAYGQFCVVLPEQDVVVAITSQSPDMQAVLDAAWEHLLPAVSDPELPADAAAHDEALARRTSSLALAPLEGRRGRGRVQRRPRQRTPDPDRRLRPRRGTRPHRLRCGTARGRGSWPLGGHRPAVGLRGGGPRRRPVRRDPAPAAPDVLGRHVHGTVGDVAAARARAVRPAQARAVLLR